MMRLGPAQARGPTANLSCSGGQLRVRDSQCEWGSLQLAHRIQLLPRHQLQLAAAARRNVGTWVPLFRKPIKRPGSHSVDGHT